MGYYVLSKPNPKRVSMSTPKHARRGCNSVSTASGALGWLELRSALCHSGFASPFMSAHREPSGHEVPKLQALA